MIIQNVHYTLNKNSRYFFQLLPGCWTGVLTVRLVKLSLLNLTAKNFCKTFFWIENVIKNKQWNRSTTNDFHKCIILLLQLTSPSGTVRKLFCIYGGNHCQKKNCHLRQCLVNEWEIGDCNEVFYRGVYMADFFFFLKIGHILFHYVNKLLRLTWGTYFIGSLPAFFPLSLNLPPRNEACVHT